MNPPLVVVLHGARGAPLTRISHQLSTAGRNTQHVSVLSRFARSTYRKYYFAPKSCESTDTLCALHPS